MPKQFNREQERHPNSHGKALCFKFMQMDSHRQKREDLRWIMLSIFQLILDLGLRVENPCCRVFVGPCMHSMALLMDKMVAVTVALMYKVKRKQRWRFEASFHLEGLT